MAGFLCDYRELNGMRMREWELNCDICESKWMCECEYVCMKEVKYARVCVGVCV